MLLILGRGSDGRGRHAARGGKHHGIGWGSTTALARTPAPIAARATAAARVQVAANPAVCAGPPNPTNAIPLIVSAVAAAREPAIDNAEQWSRAVPGGDGAGDRVPGRAEEIPRPA